MVQTHVLNNPEVLRILANIADLPPGGTLTLADIARDGFGGVVVKRHGRTDTFVFQREFSRERSRWADSLAQAIEEVEVYVNTGRLHEPDGFGF